MKKGFTLVELLAVLVILSIISLIAIPAVTKSVKNARENAYNRQNRKNELYNQARSQSLNGEQAKAFVKQHLGKKGFGAKMVKGISQGQMIKLPSAQDNTSNSHAAVGYSISPSSNKPSINSLFSNKPRRKKLG